MKLTHGVMKLVDTERIGAVIVAAGLSSRMGEFKPLLPFCGNTVVGTIVSTLRSVGAESIVVVTGREAERLKTALGSGVEYVHNASYASTPMFVSACLGLSEAQYRAERIFFTPADTPLFTRETLLRLLKSEAQVIVPTHFGSSGHPVLLNARVVPKILGHPEGTLREALAACGPAEYIEVPDSGVLLDVDTPSDYALSRLLAALRRAEPHHAEARARTLAEAGQLRLAEIVRQYMLPNED
ncbi:MAG: nucleotidyltransferase family protein [Synergistaceae bacterium]|nr:nucleotidyltransferase family protein [Synergistaceae bacterium]